MTFPYWHNFTEFTPVIPALYWDVESEEQRTKAICKQLCKLINYAAKMGVAIDELQGILEDIQAGKFDEQIREAIERWFDENEVELKTNVEKLMQDEVKLAFAAFDFENAEAYLRKPVTFEGQRYGVQGFTAFKNGVHTVSCAYLSYSNAQPGMLKSYFDDQEVSSLSVSMGHGSHMEYYNGYIYMPDYRENENKLYRWPIANTGELGTREMICNLAHGGAFAIDYDTGKAYLISQATIYEIDLGSGNTTVLVENPHFNIPENVNGQTFFTFRLLEKQYFAAVGSFPNMVFVVDENGNFVGTKDMPNFANYIRLGEMECMHIYSDGTFFAAFNEGAMPTYVNKTFIAITGNIFDMSSSIYESCSPQQYTVIDFDSAGTGYEIPHKKHEGEWSSGNPIICNYGQDVQSIITATGCNNCAIRVTSGNDANNGLYLTDFNGLVNMRGNVIPHLQFDTCFASLNNAIPMLNSKARAVEVRLGSLVSILNIFGDTDNPLTGANAGLRLNQANAIVKNGQNLSYIYMEGGAGTSTIIKADIS